MFPDPSLLTLSSAMARHAGHVHRVTADNIARADIPGARARISVSFADMVRTGTVQDGPEARMGRAAISLDEQMVRMAQNAGRHDAAVTVWSKTLDLVRLAGASPR